MNHSKQPKPSSAKVIFIMALACALASLLAMLAFSAMDFVSKTEGRTMVLIVGACAVAWLGLAFWARKRTVSPAVRWMLVCVCAVYLFVVLLVAVG